MHISPPSSVADSDWTAVDGSDLPVGISLSADHKAGQVLITLTPPAAAPRAPLDICCVIDVSGSMGTEAPVPGDGGAQERTGLSVLDIVKHSLRTIIATMKSTDRLALVTFTDSASVAARFTNMTDAGKTSVLKTIEGLYPQSSTNLWDGLKTGMTLLNDAYASADSTTGRLSTLFILTDGMPNVEPPRGHIPMLKAYLDAHPASRAFSISTFGFGYDLDSALLLEIAQVGGGGYSFIPDAGMVGTVFVHSAANTYATYAPRATLNVEIPEGVQVEVEGTVEGEVNRASWGLTIEAGDIQFGQTRDYILRFPNGTIPADLCAMATFRPFTASEPMKTDTITLAHGTNPPDLAALQYHHARLSLVTALYAAKKTGNLGAAQATFSQIEHDIAASPILAKHASAQAVLHDITGQGMLGVKDAHFARWGKHYFPSLARAHARQQCTNFKDPGLQVYGQHSKVFQQERDELSEKFDVLPPPTPSVRQSYGGQSHGGRLGGRPAVNITSMAMYQSAAGPCFAAYARVQLADGTHVRVDSLKRGAKVMTLRGPCEVAAVVRTAIPAGEAMLCELGDGLVLTPWHPIVHESKWVFPAGVATPKMMACDAIYSLLLFPALHPDAHTVSIGGIWCTTLGHGLVDPSSDVRTHAYLGCYNRVSRDLVDMKGFEGDGVVECSGTKRDKDGKICGFVGAQDPGQNMGLEVERAAVCV
ncbi:hint-domain-containing protein [Mycena metata]|uniref:Hint-domain-containing protein n=1 Tax=Mycena metata TaxID=1033252 RepID=A0AAD7J250_9AGAR|nr:hint-domain-containing protein [Mycena metata]